VRRERIADSGTGSQPEQDEDRPRVIAFYLPQFHPIPENDAWWGSGFTEWTNVARARPQFPGHYQPHLPTTLGFYDLRVPEVRVSQAAMARSYGIDGFCYYHYWFSGRRPFGRIMDEILHDGHPDLPFCLCWANHNWNRVWDGAAHEALLREEYSGEDDREHIAHLTTFFATRGTSTSKAGRSYSFSESTHFRIPSGRSMSGENTASIQDFPSLSS
jgi:lipopolysaccharide biosynthesis protein